VAIAKYRAVGSGSSKARIAKWDPKFGPRPRLQDNGLAIQTGGNKGGLDHRSGWQEFSIHNNSEVAAKFIIFVLCVKDKDFNFATVTDARAGKNAGGVVVAQKSTSVVFVPYNGEPGYDLVTLTNLGGGEWETGMVKPGETVGFRMVFWEGAPLNHDGFGTINVAKGEKCKLYAYAVQID